MIMMADAFDILISIKVYAINIGPGSRVAQNLVTGLPANSIFGSQSYRLDWSPSQPFSGMEPISKSKSPKAQSAT